MIYRKYRLFITTMVAALCLFISGAANAQAWINPPGFGLGLGIEVSPFDKGTLGGTLTAEVGFAFNFSAGLRSITSYSLNRTLSFENTLFGRWYIGNRWENFWRRLFIEVDLGIAVLVREQTGHSAFAGGAVAGLRFPWGDHWYIEPYLRVGYPSILSAGAMIGYRFQQPLPPPPPPPPPAPVGVYVGIMTFGPYVENKTGGLVYLDDTGYYNLTRLLDTSYGRSTAQGTSLYYAVHNAIANLTASAANFPTDLSSIGIITFTDGLDNNSTSAGLASVEGQNFALTEDYATYSRGEIANRTIAGNPIMAFSVGVRGNDVINADEFTATLKTLASDERNFSEIDYAQLNEKLAEIAAALTETFTEATFAFTTPSYQDGTIVRLTFDVPEGVMDTEAAGKSQNYLEGTVSRQSGWYELIGLSYGGEIDSTIPASSNVGGALNGTEVRYIFPNFSGYDPLKNTVRQWFKANDGEAWRINSEFSAGKSTSLDETRKSAAIYLILDSSTSLRDGDLRTIREAAKEFLETLIGKASQDAAAPESASTAYHASDIKLVRVPGNTSFPTGIEDTGEATVDHAYLLGETEVPYALWDTVRQWAISSSRGASRYSFRNDGVQGGGANGGAGSSSGLHPVTTVSWHDAVLWCNALTEWYNAMTRSTLTPVYQDGNGVIRDIDKLGAFSSLSHFMNSANGFRLPTSDEWELAARWQDANSTNTVRQDGWDRGSVLFTRGNSASGAIAAYINTAETDKVAVSRQKGTSPVKSKQPNSLGLYDMSGNVWEWCFDAAGASRIARGGAWGTDISSLSIGGMLHRAPGEAQDIIGFRVARSSP
jgi:formylglycine-generating enzyme required for sulfatase activity